MAVTFPQPVLLTINNKNPHENTYFNYNHAAIPDDGTCILSYELSGDIPKNISINNSGIISGQLLNFEYQTSCNSIEHLPMGKGGQNWDKNGRFKDRFFDFNFTVKCNWKEKDRDDNPCTILGSTTKNCTIKLIKDYDYDNSIWKQDYPEINTIKVKLNNIKEIP